MWPIWMLLVLALGCGLGVGRRLRQAARAEENIERLRGQASGVVYIRLADAPAPAEAPRPPEPEDAHAARVKALQAENAELVGWLTIEGADVDYPLMQSPTRPNFYLDHDFAGEESKAGLPYIDEACNALDGVNRIIYGHNMRNGTMFGSLKRYLDASFFAANGEMTLDTATGRETYRVIAAYETTIDENASFRFYTYTNITDESAYREYVANVAARSAHDAGVLPAWGQRLLTLVTCVRYRPNDRLVIIAAETAAASG